MSFTDDETNGVAVAPAYSGQDRRVDDKTARALFDLKRGHKEMHVRLNDGDVRMGNLEDAVKKNTALTQTIKSDTGEIVEFAQSVKGAFNVADMIGKLAKPLTYIIMFGTAIAGAWAAFKGVSNGR